MVRLPIVTEALRVLESQSFSRVHLDILWTFVAQSTDKRNVAKYIIAESQNEGSLLRIATALQELLDHFRTTLPPSPVISQETQDAIISREGGKCCITKQQPSWWWFGSHRVSVRHIISPSFFATPRMNKGGDMAKLLDMMFGESRMDDIRSVVGQSREECSGENLWFISDQADLAIRLGALQLSYVRDRLNQFPDQEAYRIECSTVIDSPRLFTADGVLLSEKQQRQYVTFSTKAGVKPPNQILMDFLKRFTFMSFSVGVEIKRNRGAFRTDWDGLIPTPVSLYRWIFQVIPNSVRLRVYKLLFRAGVYLYGAPGFASGPAQRVPFGLYIKWGPPNRLRNEERALKLIEQETTIPAPRHIGTCEKGDGDLYMLVTRIPGRTLKSTLFTFSTAELKNLRWDLIQVLIRLRRVQNKSGFLISNTLGEGVRYQCFGEAQCGPFYSEQDFDNFMLQKFLEPERRELRSVLSNDIVLTHGDLHGDNIIVLNGRLSGIVDWEMAAWMPSYWEYLRMERLALHEGEEILLRPEKVFKELGEDWTSLVLRQDKIWSSLG